MAASIRSRRPCRRLIGSLRKQNGQILRFVHCPSPSWPLPRFCSESYSASAAIPCWPWQYQRRTFSAPRSPGRCVLGGASKGPYAMGHRGVMWALMDGGSVEKAQSLWLVAPRYCARSEETGRCWVGISTIRWNCSSPARWSNWLRRTMFWHESTGFLTLAGCARKGRERIALHRYVDGGRIC